MDEAWHCEAELKHLWREEARPLMKGQPQFGCRPQDTGDGRTVGKLPGTTLGLEQRHGPITKAVSMANGRVGEVGLPTTCGARTF